MPFISASIDTFLTTSLAVSAGTYWLLKRTQANSQAPYRNLLTLFVILHSLYIVYVITLLWPPNLFERLHLPVNTPTEKIRAVLLASAGQDSNAPLPAPLETLLTRLSSYDIRSVYVRFGQSVIQDCEHCRTLDQYALYALPSPLLQYIREAAVVGLLTVIDSHRSRWRTLGIVLLVIACLLETYTIVTAQIVIPRDGKNVFMWADNLWLFRQIFFLILPIIIHSLPATPPPDALSAMMQTRATLEKVSRRATLLRFMRGAIMRDPALRASSTQWWDRQKVVGQLAREDEHVQNTAEKLGSGFTEGVGEAQMLPKLRTIAETILARTAPEPTA